jgi:hypothetical protein
MGHRKSYIDLLVFSKIRVISLTIYMFLIHYSSEIEYMYFYPIKAMSNYKLVISINVTQTEEEFDCVPYNFLKFYM